MTTEPVWQRRDGRSDHWGPDGPDWEVTMVDLDLDVVALAERTSAEVLRAVAEGHEPFGSVGHAWLERALTLG